MTTNIRRNLAVSVVASGVAPFTAQIATSLTLKIGQVVAANQLSVAVSNGVSPYSFAVTSGALPTGLTLGASTGRITGTITATGQFQALITVTDSTSPTPQSFSFTATFSVGHILTGANVTPPDIDYGYGTTQYQLTVNNATGTVTWTVSGNPAYVAVSSSGLLQVGTSSAPSGGGSIAYTVTATDSGTGDVVTFPIAQTVYPFMTMNAFSPGTFAAAIGATTVFDLAAMLSPVGGKPPYAYKAWINFPLPSWASISSNGLLSITPPATTTPGTSQTLGVNVLDSLGFGSNKQLPAIYVNPNNAIQNQQNGTPVGLAGVLTYNFVGSSVSVAAGVATITTGVADFYGTASGTNTYTSTTGAIALTTGELFVIKFANANTGASTLNVDSLGAVAIQYAGAALTGGELQAGVTYELAYDGSVFQIIGAKSFTLAAFGATPNSAGASLTGSVFTLQPADASNPGGISAATYLAFSKNIGLMNFSNVTVPAGNTIANTITTTQFASKPTLPASVAAGTVIELRAAGIYSTTGAPSANWQLLLGAVQLAGTGFVVAPTTVTNQQFIFDLTLIVIDNTHVEAHGTLRLQNGATTEQVYHFAPTATIAVTAVNSGVIAMQFSWATASVSNTITLRQMTCKVFTP